METSKTWGSKHDAAPILNCAPRTVRNYRIRNDIKEHIHWRRKSKTVVEYNLVLLADYMKFLSNPQLHQKNCNEFYS